MIQLMMKYIYSTLRYLPLLVIATHAFASQANATSASISVSGNEGLIPIDANASFTSYKNCDNQDPPNCTTNDSGTLLVRHNGGNMGYVSGNGSASWSGTVDGGKLAQGDHTFEAIACDSKSNCSTDTQVIQIDNTPSLTMQIGEPDGDMNIQGIVDFKEHYGGNEGYIDLYRDGSRAYYKFYETGGDSYPWSADDIYSTYDDAGKYTAGEHVLLARAVSNTGAVTEVEKTINVPEPEATMEIGEPDGDMNIGGTVDFVGHVHGNEGYIDLYRDGSRAYYKFYETGDDSYQWNADDIYSTYDDAGKYTAGEHVLLAKFVANSGSVTEVEKTINVPKPEATMEVGEPDGDMNIGGTVDFVGHVHGNEGYIDLYRDGSRAYYKFYETGDDSYQWNADDIYSTYDDAGTYTAGEHVLLAKFVANSGSVTEVEKTINVPEPQITLEVGEPDGDMNIGGTVDFVGYVHGNEGYIDLYRDGSRVYYKYYETGNNATQWKASDISSTIDNAGKWSQGEHILQAKAVAHSGSYTIAEKTITIDNTPKPTIIGSKCYPDDTFDIKGKTTFKENTAGNEGYLRIYIKEINEASYTQHGTTLYYEGKQADWKYSDFTGRRMQKSQWGQKEILVKLVATAANGATAEAVKGLVIPAMGCPTEFEN